MEQQQEQYEELAAKQSRPRTAPVIIDGGAERRARARAARDEALKQEEK